MSHDTLPENLDLDTYEHLSYASWEDDSRETVTFVTYAYACGCRRAELEYESNATAMLDNVQAADAGRGYVTVFGNLAKVYVRDADGELTAAYRELISCLDSIECNIYLDLGDYQCRLEQAAEDDVDWYTDDATAVIDGGEAAFLDHHLVDYLGDWSDYAETPRAEAIGDLAYRMAYAALDND